jgi:hypothetical protein
MHEKAPNAFKNKNFKGESTGIIHYQSYLPIVCFAVTEDNGQSDTGYAN